MIYIYYLYGSRYCYFVAFTKNGVNCIYIIIDLGLQKLNLQIFKIKTSISSSTNPYPSEFTNLRTYRTIRTKTSAFDKTRAAKYYTNTES